MRDFYNQSARPDRQDDARQRGGKPRAPKTPKAINLSRLAKELEFDLLASALGVPEKTLRNMVDGREHTMDDRHVIVMENRLYEMGIPTDWLDQPYTRILPEYLERLIQRAAQSPDKAATRRRNFKKVVDAFKDRLTLLADALDVVESSLINVSEGHLDLDNNRFGHLNMHLYQAGFPDAWLEQADAELTPEMIAGLEAKAVDSYERDLVAEEEEQAYVANPQVTPEPVTVTTTEPTPEPLSSSTTPIEEPVMAKPTQHEIPEFAMAGVKPAADTASAPNALSKIPRSVVADEGVSVTRRGRGRSTAVAAETVNGPSVTVKTSKLKAAAESPQPAPEASTVARPPKVVQVNRTEFAKTEKSERKKPVVRKAIRGSLTKEQSAKRAAALQKLMDEARYGLSATLWRDLMGFSQAYWGNIRRGPAKFNNDLAVQVEELLSLPAGWLDNPVFPPASLAAWVKDENLPRPRNKAEALQMAKASAAEALVSPEVAVPAAAEQSAPATKGSKKSFKPYAKAQVPAPTVILPQSDNAKPPFILAASAPVASPAVSAPAPAPASKPVRAAKAKPVVSQPSAVAATPAATVSAPAATAPVPAATPQITAPAPVEAAPLPAAAGAVFQWRPSESPEPIVAPGPLTQALTTVLNRFAMEGKFTEDDAMRLLYFMMQQR